MATTGAENGGMVGGSPEGSLLLLPHMGDVCKAGKSIHACSMVSFLLGPVRPGDNRCLGSDKNKGVASGQQKHNFCSI